MKIVEVASYVLRLRAEDVYLGAPPGGRTPGYAVRAPWRSLYSDRFETLLVRITADDGTTGWGEALAPVAPEIAGSAVDLLLAPQLVGAPVRGVRPLWCRLRDLMRERGHLVGHQADALAAVDIALWDLYGRATGLPVAELLGGRFRDAVPVYVSGPPEPTDERRATLAADWASRGARSVKLHLGHGVAADLATYDAVATTAPELRIAVDAHWSYDFADACRLARGLDERNALFLEAPLAPEDLEAHRELAARTVTPLAVGEALRNRYEFDAWFSQCALRIAQPDVARTGLTEALAIAELAAARHLPVAPHHSVGLGVAVAAGLHLAAAIEVMPYFEYQPTTMRVAQRILRTPLDIGPAEIPIPAGPGLGVDVDTAAVEEFAQPSKEI